MTRRRIQPVTIVVDDTHRVSGLFCAPPKARACYVLAHGAGAGMAHPFMASIAEGLADRGVATLRYQFPYADHSFHAPARTGRKDLNVRAELLDALAAWIDAVVQAGQRRR